MNYYNTPMGWGCRHGTDEQAQWVRVPTTNTDDLSLIPGNHTIENENELLKVVL